MSLVFKYRLQLNYYVNKKQTNFSTLNFKDSSKRLSAFKLEQMINQSDF